MKPIEPSPNDAQKVTTDLEQHADRLVREPVSMVARIGRTMSIVRHYRWEQIARRGWNVSRARLWRRATIRTLNVEQMPKLRQMSRAAILANVLLQHRDEGAREPADSLRQGRLRRLNQEVHVGWPIDWTVADQLSHLWRFQLHYHEFLLPLTWVDPNWELIGSVIETWIACHPPESTRRTDDAWHPYCLSRRVPVWVWLLAIRPDQVAIPEGMLIRLVQQAEVLHRNLEKDLGGNHLLENMTALAIAATVLDVPLSKAWIETVHRELTKELNGQVLPDGEHFELSPMYHCQVLGNLLRIVWMCQDVAPQLSDTCRPYAQRMLDFLIPTLHPDGEIPLLGDSGFGEAPSVREILSLAELCGLPAQSLTETVKKSGPYWIYRNHTGGDANFLIFDRGETAAAELPAHGHCDLLGFEASVGGRRWFVDSGNFNYADDSMRNYCRSSVAHNVVTTGGNNQSEIWSKFRMGRRAKITATNHGHQQDFYWARGAMRLPGSGNDCVELERVMAVSSDGSVWICVDRSVPSGNQSPAPLLSCLHHSPDLSLSWPDESNEVLVEISDGTSRRRLTFFNATVTVGNGWYCPEFGLRQRNRVLISTRRDGQLPFGWIMHAVDENEIAPTALPAGLSLRKSGELTVFDWNH